MALRTLKDIYIDQLQDMYSANTQSQQMTVKLSGAATSKGLSEALNDGVQGIQRGIDTVEKIIREHGANPTGEHCKGMEGLVKEAQAHALDEAIEDNDARDAMIITQYQRMAHYGIAGYGCLVAFANRLGLDGEAALLEKCLDGAYKGDRDMTALAKGGINEAAA